MSVPQEAQKRAENVLDLYMATNTLPVPQDRYDVALQRLVADLIHLCDGNEWDWPTILVVAELAHQEETPTPVPAPLPKCCNRNCNNQVEFEDEDLCPWCLEELEELSQEA